MTPVQLQILRARHPNIGEPTLRRNAQLLLGAAPGVGRAGITALEPVPPVQSMGGATKPAKSQGIASNDHPDTDRRTPVAQPERGSGDGALAAAQAKEGDPAFYVVRVTSYRTRLLDTDNLVPKWHIDALRYAGILPADSPDCCQVITTQRKVAKRTEERTELTIERTP